ncbi:MAG TPA: amidohydrolase [Verrucomicrobiales bacterium]|nr:amidohydrolase [Verrucomicrobiales bacterium]
MSHTTRRVFLAASLSAAASRIAAQEDAGAEPVTDIHQHTNYRGRADEHLLAHQKAMGVTTTILLPAGTPMDTPSTNQGKSNGLAAGCGTTDTCMALARAHPGACLWGANEVTDHENAAAEIEKWLKQGACIIAEQKFHVECDSAQSQRLYALAADYGVPILLHFQEGAYNLGYERFHTMLARFPKTSFIGHAQTFWGHIDKGHDPKALYPKGPVTPGGLTDRYLADYPNMFADMSAGSGLNALTRDEDHTRGFLERHQDKLLYGSDCTDHLGRGPACQGAQTLAMIRKLAATRAIERKILHGNAARLFRL